MVRVWAVATGKEVLTLRGHGMNVSSIVFTPDGWQLVSTSSGEVKVWDAEVVPERVFVQAHTSPASGLAIGPNDRWLATCSHSGEIHVWDPELGFRLKTLPGHVGGTRALCIHPTSGQLISVGEDGRIRLWDVDGDAKAEVLQEFGKQLRACACSRDGKWLAANGQGSVLLLDLTNRQLVRQFPSSLAMGAERYLAFHPTESWLCIANEEEYPLLRHLETGEVVKEWRVGEKGSGAVAISPDGLLCANGDYLRIWNLQREEPPLELHKNQYFQMGALFSPDGRRVAAGGVERIVRVWDSFTGAELLALLGHRNRVRGVAMSSDGLMLASVGEDGYLQIWDARPLTPERRDQREAASLLQFLKKRLVSQAELPERIRQHPGICDNVRSIALRLAEAR
jgi:WD40 repeat protein